MAKQPKKSRGRKTSMVPSRIWKYGIVTNQSKGLVIVNRALVEDQLHRVHHYRNKLVEIECERRERYRAATEAFPEVAAITALIVSLETELERVREAIRAERQKTRARVCPADLERAAKQLRAELKPLRARHKAARLPLSRHETVVAGNKWAKDAIKAARAASGVYWGSSGRVDLSMRSAGEGAPPEFRRWDREATLNVHIGAASKRLFVEGLLACTDTRVRLEITGQPRSSQKRFALLHFRVQSDDKGRPIWAIFPMVLHRPLPPGAEIKDVWVQRTQRIAGSTWGSPDDGKRWEVCFALESRSFDAPARLPSHAAALNLGFRLLDDEGSMRIAYLVGTDGASQEIALEGHGPRLRGPDQRKGRAGVANAIKHADAIRSTRDTLFEDERNVLLAWLRDQGDAAPEWLRMRTKTLVHWRSPDALASLVGAWRLQRFAGDATCYERLALWAQRNRHLHQYEAAERGRALGRRKHHYRNLARKICETYSDISVPDIKLAELKRKRAPEDGETELERAQRWQMNTAALGEFTDALKLAASNTGARVHKITIGQPPRAAPGSAIHYVCGKSVAADRAKSISVYCEHCGVTFDQDENAARNLLAFRHTEAAE